MSFSVKVIAESGDVSWIVCNNRYNFTKSKAEFILQCAVKGGIFVSSSLEVVENA